MSVRYVGDKYGQYQFFDEDLSLSVGGLAPTANSAMLFVTKRQRLPPTARASALQFP